MIPRKPVQRAYKGLVGLPPEANDTPLVSVAVLESATEEQARALFGVDAPTPATSKLAQGMRQTLMLEPEVLIALFDESPATIVAQPMVFQQVDFIVPPEMLQHRIKRLKKLLATSKDIVEGLSKHIMKLRRAEDNILDKPTREKYKREENARIVRLNAKLYKYRTALGAGNYREKVWRFQVKPVYFHELVDDYIQFVDYGAVHYEKDKHKTPADGAGYWTTNLVRDVIATGIFDVERYAEMMKIGCGALQLMGESDAEGKRIWANLQRWENLTIKAAVFHGVLRPRADLMKLLALTPFAKQALSVDDTPIEADTTENALALKTGGACYGASIHSAGYRYNVNKDGGYRRRALESFDKSKPPQSWEEGGSQPGDTGSDLYHVHDAVESYDPR